MSLALAVAFLAVAAASAFAQSFERTFAGGAVPLPGYRPPGDSWAFDPVLDPDTVAPGPEATHVYVRNADELNQALAAAGPGQVITLADGVYDSGGPFRIRGVRASASSPLIIRAEHRGQAVIAGRSWFYVQDSSYVVIDGLTFTTTDETTSHGVRLTNTSYSRVTRNHFALVESPNATSSRHWVYISGTGADYNRIDHNLFEKKRRIGNFISVAGDDIQVAQHTRIDRNHFKDALPVGANGMEAIRIGVSGISRSHAFAVIEYNLFEQCNGDAEIISVKSGGNVIRYNTFWESEGAVTFRHGNDNRAYGNYFLGNGKPNTGGIRVYGRGHMVYNNHFEGLRGTGIRSALTIGAGDVAYQEQVMNYWRVERLLAAHNTFVNNQSGIHIASGAYPAVSTVIANNLLYSDQFSTLITEDPQAQITWIGNIAYAAGRALVGVSKDPGEIRIADPLLIPGIHGVHYVDERSPAVDAALQSSAFEAIQTDIEGKPRDERFDVGAFEYVGLPLLRGPLTPSEVGPGALPAKKLAFDAPGVYITDVRLEGDVDQGSEWWGPVSVHVALATTGETPAPAESAPASPPPHAAPVVVTALVDGVQAFQGEVRSSGAFTLDHGKLSDGEHVLTVAAERDGLRDEVSLRFTTANVRIESPAPNAAARGDLPIEAAIGLPPEELAAVRVMLDDTLIYSGAQPPVDLVVHTPAYADGPHRLTVEALGKGGARAARSVTFEIDNFWEVSDALRPPVDWGPFGVINRSLASAKSDGWGYETGSPTDFGGDADRMTIQSDAAEFLIWETPRLSEAWAILYAKDPALDEQVLLSASVDGESWRDVSWKVRSAERLESGWHRLELGAELPDSSGFSDEFNYFRLLLRPGENAAAGDIQVGHVTLRGRQPR